MIIIHTSKYCPYAYMRVKWIITFKNKILDAAKLQRRMAKILQNAT